jgi:sugar lactone lactonase YvrE
MTHRNAFVVGMIVLAVGACRPTDSSSEITQSAVTVVPVGPRPESITRAWGGEFYVSIQGPSGALGTFDGEVRKVDLAAGTSTTFVTGLENPRGLAFTGEFLIAADQQKIYKIDQAGNATILAKNTDFPFPAVFFNDAAPEHGGQAVFVTEMGRRDIIREPAGSPNAGHLIPPDSDAAFAVPATSRVYRITMNGKITSMFEPSRKLLVMNGVTEAHNGQGNRLLATDFFHGNIVEIDTNKGEKNIIATAFRGADGLEQGSDGTIYVSSFELGAVWKMDANGENMKVLIDHQGFQSTADFYLDEAAKKLYVPSTPAGAILIVPTDI